MDISSVVFEQLRISNITVQDEEAEIAGEFIFNTQIVGVTLESETGRNRQKLIRRLKRGEVLELEPDQQDGDYANELITVLNCDQQDIGYLPFHHGSILRDEFESGHRFFAKIQDIVGGVFQNKSVHIGIYKM